MSRVKKGISERAVDWLEEKKYLDIVRAEMKAEVMKCLVEMEEAGEIPPHLRIKRYSPPDDANRQALGYVLEFMRFHQMNNAIQCLIREVNGEIDPAPSSDPELSLIAQAIRQKTPAEDEP
jgi:hypothetical protein